MLEEEQSLAPVENEDLTIQQPQNQISTMWNDSKVLAKAWRAAQMLSKTDLVPDNYKGKPENCLIAVDVANRTALSPLMVMQNLTVVRGRPAWNGQSSIALVNGCGRFSAIEFVYSGEGNDFGCVAQAVRLASGKLCESERVTIQMAKDEGWLDKTGSKWKTMPRLMMQYRSGAFFARAYCPDVLLGIQTADEIIDVKGEEVKEKTVISIESEDK
jgi:hypothetical protein